MNNADLWIAHLDLYFWLAVVTGCGGLVIGIMCLWKLKQISLTMNSEVKELVGRYEKIIGMLNTEADEKHAKRVIPPTKK